MPFGPAAAASLTISVDKFRPLQLERLEFAVHRLVERCGRLGARLGERAGGGAIVGFGLRGRGHQRLEPLLAGVDQRDIGFVARRQRRQFVDRHVVFAPGRAQREQALLDAFEFGRIEIGGAQRLLEVAAGFLQCGERGVERLHRRLDQARGLRRAPLQPADHAGKLRHG